MLDQVLAPLPLLACVCELKLLSVVLQGASCSTSEECTMKGVDQRCRTVHTCTNSKGEPVKSRVEPVPDSLVGSMVDAISNLHGVNVSVSSPAACCSEPLCSECTLACYRQKLPQTSAWARLTAEGCKQTKLLVAFEAWFTRLKTP